MLRLLKVNIGDLENEKENLANFLRTQFSVNSSITRKGLELKMEESSTQALTKMVNKFVYRKNLNHTHWVSIKNNVVKINRFNHQKKDRLSNFVKILMHK